MRLSLSLCLAIVLVSPSLAATSAERTALIARARELPALTWSQPSVDHDREALREQLLTLNPGREKDIDPVVTRFGACMAAALDQARPLDQIAARLAASTLTDDELRQGVDFYDRPEWRTFFEGMSQLRSSAEVEDRRTEDLPAGAKRFLRVLEQAQAEVYREPLNQGYAPACVDGLSFALGEAGLSND